jgi:hypothetical protein
MQVNGLQALSRGKMKVITFNQALQLKELPNLERRIKRDLDDALLVASHHITGEWPSYTPSEKVESERIAIVLHNDRSRLESGKPVVECFVIPKLPA